jgi:hypothetical protein
MSRLQHFEEFFLYRVARGFPAAAAAIAGGLLICAIAVVLYTVTPTREPVTPKPAQLPAEVSVNAADVALAIRTAQPATPATTAAAPTASVSNGARTVAIALHQLRELLPSPTYIWRDEYEMVCTNWYYGYCLNRERQLTARGVSSTITGILDLYDAPNTEAEKVELKEVSTSYNVNGSNDVKKVAVLKEAAAIVSAVPIAERGRQLRAWSKVRRDRESARQELIAAEEARVAREAAAEEQRYSQQKLEKTTNRLLAATIAGYSIATICFVGLALALLAIERNTRHLRSVVALAPTRVTASERVASGQA